MGSGGLAEAIAARLAARVVLRDVRPPLHDKQAAFVYSSARHAAFVAGIGSGKSWAGAVRAIRAGLGYVGDMPVMTPNLGVVTAPTYPMLRDATLRTFLDLAEAYVPGFDRDGHFNKSEMIARLPNGSEVLFRSTEHPDRLRGPSIAWWFGDEAAMYPAVVRRIMIGRLRQHGARGWDWITTTPRGKNWVWQTYADKRQGDPDYLLVRAASSENTYLDPEIVQMWETEYAGDFARQELGGEFVAMEGLIYPEFDHDRHTFGQTPEGLSRFVVGVDWGYANPGVMLVFGVDGDGRMYLVEEDYRTQTRIEDWQGVALGLREAWGVQDFVCDPSEPEYIKALQAVGIKAVAADNSVMPGIQAVKARLAVRGDGRTRLMVGRGAVNTLREFEAYQWASNRDGVKDAPVKAHDHAMDALRYAVMLVDKPLKTPKVRVKSYVG